MTSQDIISLKIFISYSHDSAEHMSRVLRLADRLRADGIDCELDQYEESPPEGWPKWARRKMTESEYVLVACTETYLRRFDGKEDPGKGRGVKWEGAILTQELYEADGRNQKFIPVVFSADELQYVPIELRGTTHYILSVEADFDKLYRRLTNQPLVTKPQLGQLKRLPSREQKAEFSASPWNVPYRRNPLFTGRDAELKTLRQTLESKGVAVCTGLGGMGKTQTAVEYAYRYREQYSGVLWARMETRESAISDFVAIAYVLNLQERHFKDQTRIVSAVKNWIAPHSQVLLILDNADDLQITEEFIPTGKIGHILLTSRAHATNSIGPTIEIDRIAQAQAVQFLLRRGRITALDGLVEHASKSDQETANEITALLDGLPLALDQAGAYLEETGCGLAGYLALYKDKAMDLLKYRGATSDHPDPVATTWRLSFDRVKAAHPAASELLCLCAFLHPEEIPEELITNGATELGHILGAAGAKPAELNKVIAECLKFSLLHRDPIRQTLEIHRLVQEVVRTGINETTQRQWVERLVRALNISFPKIERATWPQCERLIPYIVAVTASIARWKLNSSGVDRLFNQAGQYLVERARYAEAEPFLRRSVAIREELLGKEHPDVAIALNNLAMVIYTQGRYVEVEPLHLLSLKIRENAFGAEHPDVAATLNNLASLYRSQGRYPEVEPLYRRSLKIREETLGKEHPDVAQSLNNLASFYDSQGRGAEAEPLLKRSLLIWEKVFGKEHREVARCLNNLAELYRRQGRHAEAEPLYQRSLEIRENLLGKEHPDVAIVLNNLALLYHAQGHHAEVETLCQRSLAIREKALGPEHPDVAYSLNNLAELYRTRGRHTEAEPLYQRSLAIREKILGREHPEVAQSLNNLAELYRLQGRHTEAEPLYQRSIAIADNSQGKEHLDVARVLENYATLLKQMNRTDEGNQLMERANRIRHMRLRGESDK